MVWRYYVLPFGLTSAPVDFLQFSQLIRNILRENHIVIWLYINDFFSVNLSCTRAEWDFKTVGDFHATLFIKKNAVKAIPPIQLVVILGYKVDTVRMTVTIPEKKLDKIYDLCASTLVQKEACLQKIQELIDCLVFAAQVVRGWIFFLRMFHLLKLKMSCSNSVVHLTSSFLADVHW
jgi:hypothetical protein